MSTIDYQKEKLRKAVPPPPKKKKRKAVPFTTALKRIKFLRIYLAKKGKDSYTENYKTLIKGTEENTNKRKVSVAHGLEALILLKCLYYPKQSTDSM